MATEDICFVIIMSVILVFILLFIGMMISSYRREEHRYQIFMSEVRRLRGEIDETFY